MLANTIIIIVKPKPILRCIPADGGQHHRIENTVTGGLYSRTFGKIDIIPDGIANVEHDGLKKLDLGPPRG
jgi:hypothetical protein